MLTQLTVKNLAIVESLELHFDNGMHVITGETGAGKSIIIDALSLALGERASPEQIRAGQTQAEVTACFDIRNLPTVQKLIDTDEEECIIRRIINVDGRSRAYINGVSATAHQLKALAIHLVQIHSQHQHHALLTSEHQRELLDAYATHNSLLAEVETLFKLWATTNQELLQVTNLQNQAEKLTLLNYQLQELEALNLQPDELNVLDQQQKQLSKSEDLLQVCQEITDKLSADQGVLDQLHASFAKLGSLQNIAPQLKQSIDLLQQSVILIQECDSELQDYSAKLDLDPAQLQNVEQRLSAIHALARKLRVSPERLLDHQQQLFAQRDELTQASQRLHALQDQLDLHAKAYQATSNKLTQSRKQAAKKLTAEVIVRLKTLEMPNVDFFINFTANKLPQPTSHGSDTISFMVSTNPGQPADALKKVASGGELSRISLAIQVITAQQMAIPTLILDEVDVGISGKTAATVGQLMRELGANAQIVCITHLPQVASQGHIHFKVSKSQTEQGTATQITPLGRNQRVAELARLLGGIEVTPEALAHAERLLNTV